MRVEVLIGLGLAALVVMVLAVKRVFGGSDRGGGVGLLRAETVDVRHDGLEGIGLPVDQEIQLAPVEPDPPALRAEIDLDPLTIGGGQHDVAVRAFHVATSPG